MFQNTTNLVGYIALLMTLSAGLAGGFSGNETAMASNAFSARDSVIAADFLSSQPVSQNESEYVRIYINGVAYEGTLHVAR